MKSYLECGFVFANAEAVDKDVGGVLLPHPLLLRVQYPHQSPRLVRGQLLAEPRHPRPPPLFRNRAQLPHLHLRPPQPPRLRLRRPENLPFRHRHGEAREERRSGEDGVVEMGERESERVEEGGGRAHGWRIRVWGKSS